MGYLVAALVSFGLVAYLAANLVGVGDDPPRQGLGTRSPAVRRFLDLLLGLSPLFLALIWIAYGTLHLVSPSSEAVQIPQGWFEGARSAIWAASGALEIAMGLLVVDPRWRRWSLLAQLLMLIALTPFVAYMLTSDCALDDVLPGLRPSAARVVLVLHNLLLFVWVARLYRDERKRSPDVTPTTPPAPSNPRGNLRRQPVVIVAVVLLAANLAGCSVIAMGPWQSGALYLWAMGSLATGGLLGFLFGVPRWVAAKERSKSGAFEPNTNIEAISDWLTKMLVGVGLVQLHQLGPTVYRVAAVLASGLTVRQDRHVAPNEAQSFATGLVTYFLVAGIIEGFLLTRMFLTRAWNEDATLPSAT